MPWIDPLVAQQWSPQWNVNQHLIASDGSQEEKPKEKEEKEKEAAGWTGMDLPQGDWIKIIEAIMKRIARRGVLGGMVWE